MLDETLERRRGLRMRLGVACRLLVDGRCYRGIVKLLSRSGLLVEVPARFPRCAEAIVAFDPPEGGPFILETTVVDPSPVARSLASLRPRYVGLRIQDPPDAYRVWVQSFGAVTGGGSSRGAALPPR